MKAIMLACQSAQLGAAAVVGDELHVFVLPLDVHAAGEVLEHGDGVGHVVVRVLGEAGELLDESLLVVD